MNIDKNQFKQIKNYASMFTGFGFAILYGVIFSYIYKDDSLSIATIFIAPIVLGAIAVFFSTAKQKKSIPYAIVAPWVPVFFCLTIVAIFTWEALFCIFLGFPIFFLMGSFGGLVVYLIRYIFIDLKGAAFSVGLAVLALPYLVFTLEHKFPTNEEIRQVSSSILINAPAEIVWNNITNFDELKPSEQHFAFFHILGLPRPITSEMDCEAVGCIRKGHWEDGLSFDGTISQITPGKSFWVDLAVDTSNVTPSMAPLHQIGKAFDMIDDGYEIESLPDGTTKLTLYSTYKINSRVNGYAALWLDFLLKDMERYLLGIEKIRSESTIP